jgi:hypothetical protein
MLQKGLQSSHSITLYHFAFKIIIEFHIIIIDIWSDNNFKSRITFEMTQRRL